MSTHNGHEFNDGCLETCICKDICFEFSDEHIGGGCHCRSPYQNFHAHLRPAFVRLLRGARSGTLFKPRSGQRTAPSCDSRISSESENAMFRQEPMPVGALAAAAGSGIAVLALAAMYTGLATSLGALMAVTGFGIAVLSVSAICSAWDTPTNIAEKFSSVHALSEAWPTPGCERLGFDD